jgi:hypothetical protein
LQNSNEAKGAGAATLWCWRERDGTLWVGDAKYKISGGADWPKIDDTRQLICYGQLAAQLHRTAPSSLMLLYPTTGEEISEMVETMITSG